MQFLRELPTPALAALGVLLALQLSLQLWALIDLTRRPAVQGGRKWVWALVIVLGNLLGALAYLAMGRKVPETVDLSDVEQSSRDDRERTRTQAIDRLYGDRDA